MRYTIQPFLDNALTDMIANGSSECRRLSRTLGDTLRGLANLVGAFVSLLPAKVLRILDENSTTRKIIHNFHITLEIRI